MLKTEVFIVAMQQMISTYAALISISEKFWETLKEDWRELLAFMLLQCFSLPDLFLTYLFIDFVLNWNERETNIKIITEQ